MVKVAEEWYDVLFSHFMQVSTGLLKGVDIDISARMQHKMFSLYLAHAYCYTVQLHVRQPK